MSEHNKITVALIAADLKAGDVAGVVMGAIHRDSAYREALLYVLSTAEATQVAHVGDALEYLLDEGRYYEWISHTWSERKSIIDKLRPSA